MRRRLPPLISCAACGRTFRSWNPHRYCARPDCVARRADGPSAEIDRTAGRRLRVAEPGGGDRPESIREYLKRTGRMS
jgi:hypothetical protein